MRAKSDRVRKMMNEHVENDAEMARLRTAMHLFSGRAADHIASSLGKAATRGFVHAANELVFELTTRLGTVIQIHSNHSQFIRHSL